MVACGLIEAVPVKPEQNGREHTGGSTGCDERPDPERPYSKIILVAMDTRQLHFDMEAGVDDPKPTVGSFHGMGRIPRDETIAKHAVAAFNGGFKLSAGAGGYMQEGHVVSRLSRGYASLVIDRLERAGHIRRARDHPADNRVVHLRYTDQGKATGLAFFGSLGDRAHAILDGFTGAGGTVVMSSHVMALVEQVCDHVAVLDHGQLRRAGTLAQVRAGHTLDEAFAEIVGTRPPARGRRGR